MPQVIDETGKTYGRLTVVERYVPTAENWYLNTSHAALWLCECRCGNTTIVQGSALRRGATKSCGCLRLETSAANGANNKGRRYKHKPREEL